MTDITPEALEALNQKAVKLWSLLDDIDTLDDACKSNDEIFRELVRKVQRKRFDVMSGDEWEALRTGQLVPVQQPSGDVVDIDAIVKQALSVATIGTPGEIAVQIAHNAARAAITAYEALRAKDTRP